MSSTRITITCPSCNAVFRRRKGFEEERPLIFCAYCGKALPRTGGTPEGEQPPPADQMGHYKLIERIGRGGMGEVYLAYDSICERTIALKQIRSDLLSNPQLQKRFLREAQITSQLTHPTIIPIYSIHAEQRLPYYTMPYVEGETLRHMLRRERLQDPRSSIPALTRIFLQVCQACAYAHSHGILHRDLKPENFIVGKYGQVLILDWGLAKHATDTTNDNLPATTASPHITRTGKVVGTIAYMAPERALGNPATIRTDIYSLGVILYQILTFKLPFRRKNLKHLKASWEEEQFYAPEAVAPYREVPHVLSAAAQRCLAKDPAERYQSVDELIECLEHYIEGKSEWILAKTLEVGHSEDWQMQENILIPEHTAITRTLDVSDWVCVMIARESFPDTTRVELTVQLERHSQGVGILFAVPPPAEPDYYNEGYCLWFSSKGATLSRAGVTVLHAPDTILKPNEPYRIRIERIDGDPHITCFVNDIQQFTYLSHLPVTGSHVGLLLRDADLTISRFAVLVGSQSIRATCLAVPDAFLAHGDYDHALAEYRKIAAFFPGRTEGRDALFRAGVTLLEQAKSAQQPALLEQAHEQFDTLHHTPGAPLAYLGKALIYQYTHETTEELKCYELAARRYKQHPLLQVVEEQLSLRMHESSRHSRLYAYAFVLLVARLYPILAATPPSKQLFVRVEEHWERPWFLLTAPANDQLAFCLTLATILERPHVIGEIVRELVQRPVIPSQLIADALFAIVERGEQELFDELMGVVRGALSANELERFRIRFGLVEHARNGAITTAPLDSYNNETERLLLWATRQAIQQGKLEKASELLQLITTPADPERVDAIRLELCLLKGDTVGAAAIVDRYPPERLFREESQLFFPYRCWLATKKRPCAPLLPTSYPRSWLLGAHVLAGHLSLERLQLFGYEQRALAQQLALYYTCTDNHEQAQRFRIISAQ